MVISVVVPVYNGQAFVAEAIDSALAQAGPREVVVVDDGSTDDTPKILSRYGDSIHVVRQKNRGLPGARNAGVRAASGDLVCFLDADDLHPPDYLARFRAAAEAAPDADVCHCGWRGVTFDGEVLYENPFPLPLDEDTFHRIVRGSPPVNAMCVRRRVFARVGEFDERYRIQDDWDFWLRMAVSGTRFKSATGNVALVRRHGASLSARGRLRMVQEGLAILQRHVDAHLKTCRAAERCPAIREIGFWKRAALQASADGIARRLSLSGRAGTYASLAIALAVNPRLLPAAFVRLQPHFKDADA
jgi:glycosyltransferase involved in cell wall biosynthesis